MNLRAAVLVCLQAFEIIAEVFLKGLRTVLEADRWLFICKPRNSRSGRHGVWNVRLPHDGA